METTNGSKNGALANGHRFTFDNFEIDPANRILLREGEVVPLTGRIFDVLLVFVENPGRLLEKDELIEKVWHADFVEEGNLARNVSTLRKALGDAGKEHKYIATVPGHGYRFVADVDVLNGADAMAKNRGPEKSARETSEDLAESYLPPPIKKRRKRDYLIAAAGAVAVILISLLAFKNQLGFSSGPGKVRTIAVLPFKALADENDDPLYKLGITDSVIVRLSGVKGLIVRPLSATRKYNDLTQDPVAIGKEQQVDYVITSNYQIANGRIRITSQLINVASGEVEEKFTDEEGNSDIFAAQNAIAEKFGDKLLARFDLEQTQAAPKHYTNNEDAYRLYLQGMNLADKRDGPSSRKAVDLFEEAVRLDPNYARAYAGLAFAHRSVSIFGGNQQEEYLKSKQAVERALELDNNLAAAHTILGEIEFSYEWKFPEAEKELRHAIELDPNSAFAHRFYAIYLSDMGRFDESVAEIKTAIDIDPNSNWNQRIFGFILFFARRYDEAITQLMRAAEMDSNQGANYGWLSVAFEQKGDYEHAFEYYVLAMEKWGATAGELDTWKSTYAKSGWQGILRRRLDQAKQAQTNSDRSDFGEAATLSAKLGEKEQAFAYLEKLFEKRDVSILWLLSNPDYDSLRSDPRLDELAARIGLNKK